MYYNMIMICVQNKDVMLGIIINTSGRVSHVNFLLSSYSYDISTLILKHDHLFNC